MIVLERMSSSAAMTIVAQPNLDVA
jgi:hypothetical protein